MMISQTNYEDDSHKVIKLDTAGVGGGSTIENNKDDKKFNSLLLLDTRMKMNFCTPHAMPPVQTSFS